MIRPGALARLARLVSLAEKQLQEMRTEAGSEKTLRHLFAEGAPIFCRCFSLFCTFYNPKLQNGVVLVVLFIAKAVKPAAQRKQLPAKMRVMTGTSGGCLMMGMNLLMLKMRD